MLVDRLLWLYPAWKVCTWPVNNQMVSHEHTKRKYPYLLGHDNPAFSPYLIHPFLDPLHLCIIDAGSKYTIDRQPIEDFSSPNGRHAHVPLLDTRLSRDSGSRRRYPRDLV